MITPDMMRHRSAWNVYYRYKGIGRAATPWFKPPKSQMKVMLEKFKQFAVPCEWPWDFDQSVSEADLSDYRLPEELARHNDLEIHQQGTVEDRRRKAQWAKAEMRKAPRPDAFRNMAEKDPNRAAAPPGWKRP